MISLNSLTTRIFAIFWLTMALVLMLVLLLPTFDSRQLMNLDEEEQEKTSIMQKMIERELTANGNTDSTQAWRRIMIKPPIQGQRLIMVTNEGRIVGSAPHDMKTIRNFIGLSDNASQPKKKKYERLEIMGPFSVSDGKDNYFIYTTRPSSSPQSDFINLLFDRPFFLLAVTMLISAPLLLGLAWSLAKPARKLKAAADDVTAGQLRARPDLESGPVEFRAAGISFNQMVTALDLMVSAQQRLISDISHELRTPLTRLQLATALMRRKQGEGVELERIETEAQRLESMINNLLLLSRSQYKNELSREVVKASDLWSDVLDNAMFEAEQVGKSLKILSPPQAWPLFCNPNSLDSALENIIRNALRYSNHAITISFSSDGQGLSIVVDDDGPGVSEAEREHIFRPFYRTDEARDRSSGGSGLGLAIVESAISQHGGRVSATQSPLGGLRITLWLPLYI